MLANTLTYLKCPCCEGDLACPAGDQNRVSCTACRKSYPVLAGVLLLVPDVGGYLLEHVKGIARQVDDAQIPKEHRAAFIKAKRRIPTEHIEEDLEAERVNALYVMNHYLRARDVRSPSPAVDEVIKKYWDAGPFAKIKERVVARGGKHSLIELGCGVGGLFAALHGNLKSYLGLDSSFASIALARHLALGAPYRGKILIPDDLLQGTVSREVKIPAPAAGVASADFIVCDLAHPPVKPGLWDMSAALNVIDMLDEPKDLPALQHDLLKRDGVAIQSCPYVWHQHIAAQLREALPKKIKDSAEAVEWLYRERGFKIESIDAHVPWVFFKHIRQIELYSVHLFFASK